MSFKPARFVPFMASGRQIGWLQPELAARLAAWPRVFDSKVERVKLLEPKALPEILEQLAQEGFIPGWRNERYRIADLFDIERAAARPFGLATHAVHVNGISGEKMWLARRAATKPIDPGMLDNLVGGGVTAGLSLEEVLVKEAWEEAGIPAEIARTARRGGDAQILREVPEGVQSETVHVFDLQLPAGFEPRNQDGEVSEVRLFSFDEVRSCKELTLEAELAVKDYFKRVRSSGR
jgi:8-oxo-dGTP pyrophosphatase MutT (NUDIX family)